MKKITSLFVAFSLIILSGCAGITDANLSEENLDDSRVANTADFGQETPTRAANDGGIFSGGSTGDSEDIIIIRPDDDDDDNRK